MIQRLSHSNVFVDDQDRAKAFYVDTLGFEVREDVTLGTFRWLAVGPKGQPDLALVLFKLQPSSFLPEDAVSKLREVQKAHGLSSGVFQTSDIRRLYDELKAKGVEFTGEPTERPYGTECLMKDDSGNWFSIVERPRGA